jgi:hypothetical protein
MSSRANERVELLHAFGLIQTAIGDQSGNAARLEEEAAAFGAAVDVLTGDYLPQIAHKGLNLVIELHEE